MKNEPPKPPLSRILKEGVLETCPNCGSSAEKKPMFFGNRYCININCYYHEVPILANVKKMREENKK